MTSPRVTGDDEFRLYLPDGDSAGDMRDRAASLRAGIAQIVMAELQIGTMRRQAVQAEYEAGLWDVAEDKLCELAKVIGCDPDDMLPGQVPADSRALELEAAVTGAEKALAVAARTADRADRAAINAAAVLERAEGAPDGDPDKVADLAARAASLRRMVSAATLARDEAGKAVTKARDEAKAHLTSVQAAYTAYAEAGRAAESPGTAPHQPDEVPTIRLPARPQDMDALQKEWVREAYGVLVHSFSSPVPPPRPQTASGANWRGELAAADPERTRALVADGRGTTIIIPATGRG